MKLNLSGLFGGNRQKVTITAINLKLHNYVHSIAGMEVRGRRFSIDVPFTNKSHSDMLTEAASFKAGEGEDDKDKRHRGGRALQACLNNASSAC